MASSAKFEATMVHRPRIRSRRCPDRAPNHVRRNQSRRAQYQQAELARTRHDHPQRPLPAGRAVGRLSGVLGHERDTASGKRAPAADARIQIRHPRVVRPRAQRAPKAPRPAATAGVTSGAGVTAGGRVAPINFDDHELRQAWSAVSTRQTYRIEKREFATVDPLLPPALAPNIVGPIYEQRLLAGQSVSVPLGKLAPSAVARRVSFRRSATSSRSS